MKKIVLSFILLLSSLALIVSVSAATNDSESLLNETVPDQYEVVTGDTLWDISALFLRDPWMWPEIWHANQQIAFLLMHLSYL